ncbi:MAG: LPS assembly lipoprotein LptE [Rhodovibrionaceae bacterium]
MLPLFLAGCNFQPLYAENPGNSNWAATDYLAQVQILPLEDRTGQIMHNLLRDRLNPKGQPGDPGYFLMVFIQERTEDLAIRRDETATRANLRVTGEFRLLNQDRSQVLFRSQAVSFNSYNILDSELSTMTAKQSAREASLRELADSIQVQLAAFFTRETQSGRSGVLEAAAARLPSQP